MTTNPAAAPPTADQFDAADSCIYPGLQPAFPGEMRTYPYADHLDADIARWAC